MTIGHFGEGSLWSTGGVAKALTTGYVVGDEIYVSRENMLTATAVLGGTAATSIDLKLEISIDGGTTWIDKPIGGIDELDGATSEHTFRIFLTENAHFRFSAKRSGGAADTTLLLTAQATRPEALPAMLDEQGRIRTYDENSSSAAAGDVAHDAVDSGNPVKIGFRARTSQIAAVANDDRTDGVANDHGEQVTAGYSWASDAQQVVGEVADDAADAGFPVAIGGIARSAQRAAVGALDRVKATFNVYGEAVLAAYSWTLNALRTSEVNPLSEQYAADELEESSIVSGATYYHYIDMAGYSHLTIVGNCVVGTDGQTITLEATCQDDGTAPASIAATAWEDITQYGVDWLGSAAAANVATSITFGWSVVEAARFKYVRIKYVTGAGAGDDAAHNLYVRKTAV